VSDATCIVCDRPDFDQHVNVRPLRVVINGLSAYRKQKTYVLDSCRSIFVVQRRPTAKSRHLRITVFFDYLDYFLGTDIAISTNLTLCNKCEHS
jgi:hypothetical protein